MDTHESVRTPLGDRELDELPELKKINSPTQKPVVRISKNFSVTSDNISSGKAIPSSPTESRNAPGGKKRQYIALMVSKVVMGEQSVNDSQESIIKKTPPPPPS